MKVYLLMRVQPLYVQGYEVGTDSYVYGVYSTRQKAIKVMCEIDDEPYVNYHVVEREVM